MTLPLMLGPTFTDEQRIQFSQELLERLAATPGVRDVSAGVLLPFVIHGGSRCCWRTRIQPVPVRDEDERIATIVHPVTPGYFRVLGAKMIAGREFVAADTHQEPVPAVMNESLARRLFETTDVVGRTFTTRETELTVVGIVDELRHWGQAEDVGDQLYVPHARFAGGFERLHVAVKTDDAGIVTGQMLRDVVWSLQRNLPVGEPMTMRQRVGQSVAQPRFYAMLLAGFATVAILLAAGGVYGSMLYSVHRRQREVGIRMAVGAQASDVLRLIVGHGVLPTTLGLGAGLMGAYALARVLDSMVFGVTTTDPVTFVSVAAILGVIALTACYVPARKASRTDPIQTLRAE